MALAQMGAVSRLKPVESARARKGARGYRGKRPMASILTELTLSPEEANAVQRSALAGLTTSAGAALAVSKSPGPRLLAGLLGSALGVMGVLAGWELVAGNAIENGPAAVIPAASFSAAAYALIAPYIPQPPLPEAAKETEHPAALAPGKLLRLGAVMALAMGVHNLPEGLAVALSSGSKVGPLLAIAIAVHNVSEGAVVAGPLFAATNKRLFSFSVSTLSGVAEPIGALIAVLALRPTRLATALPPALGAAGGLMLAVCFMELLPEGRRCKQPFHLALGAAAGSSAMTATLALGA